MPPTAKYLRDGTFSWLGGMDLSRSAYAIDPQQYAKGVNVAITTVGDNIRPRLGFHWQGLKFSSPKEQELFETGNVQGAGWYFDGQRDTIVISIAGVIFHLQEITPGTWKARTLNLGNPNNPTRTKAWTCRIPGNRIIISDGQNPNIVVGLDGAYIRTNSAKGQMYPCQMMTYVQNRLWWVDETGGIVYGSDLSDPLSIQEALDTNLFGFYPPDDRDTITAVGQQRFINFDQNGGELVFSTANNVYAVNVPASVPREQWGRDGVGMVRLVMPMVGATSGYSFTNYNTNLFYRSRSLGIVNYKQLQTQFANNDELVSNSIEVDYWLKADTEWCLDQCYTVNYKGRLLTTTSPALRDGFCYWRGMISMNPAPYYGGKARLPRRFEGLWTGVQPWCLIHQEGVIEKLFVVSADGDGRTRLYMASDEDAYDIGPDNKIKPITGFVETRSYAFGSPETMKVFRDRYYTLDLIKSNVTVNSFSRVNLQSRWFPLNETTHYLPKCCRDEVNCFPWNTVEPEPRREWRLPSEKEKCENPCDTNGQSVPYRAYRLEFTGDYELSSFGVMATTDEDVKSLSCAKKDNRFAGPSICHRKDFSYQIVPKPVVVDPATPITTTVKATPKSSSCGCS